ncbi:uncharacterized protein LOC133195824 [Saccostrea echinata]|uniref:uncharacterized protein LOC133195824 n=1 Tax=Saccostrea echinata TaxID=191078 RepID=UPI002A81C823|nr:uncharacterized protein LOC133195824 [Saccostrea echinata]
MSKSGFFGLESREVVRVKVKKYESFMQPESKKFSLDPQITSFEMLQHIIASAFNIRGDFTMSYLVRDDYGQEIYLSMLSDWDMDAAIQSASDPCLQLKVDARPFEEGLDDWDIIAPVDVPQYKMSSFLERNILGSLTGTLSSGMGKTLTQMQRAMGIKVQEEVKFKAAKPPMSDQEFRNFLDSIGHMIKPEEFRISIYQGGCEPSLRRVAWRHLLNIFPNGLSGKERFEYMKRKEKEYFDLRDHWKRLVNGESMSEEMKFVTSMVKKDVLRTDRTHKFYSGSDDNKNLISLFNVLVTFALTHPETSYCQGMSDIASPLLVIQKDEAQTYLCFCAIMRRLKNNFNIDGQAITMKFKHLSDLLHVHDSELHSYFQKINASDLFFCYRWILLELKREFPFEDALYMLEVMWSTLPPDPPSLEVPLVDESFSKENLSRLPCSPSFGIQQTVYAKLNALRRQKSILKNNSSFEGENISEEELSQKSVNNNSRTTDILDESGSVVNSQEYPVLNDTETQNMVVKSSSIDGSLKDPVEKSHDDKVENFHEKDLHFQISLDNVKNIPESDETAFLTFQDFIQMKLNWKFKFCCLIAVVLVTSILYELWFVGGEEILFYKPVSRQSSKDIFSFSLNQQHVYQTDGMLNNRFFSAEDVTDFILLILKDKNVMVALQTVWKKTSRDKEKLLYDLIKNEKFEDKANFMLKDILNKRNKNVFLDINEKYEFSVLNRTCQNIERDLQGRGKCILSLEDTLCSERKLSDKTKRKKQKNKSQQIWTGQKVKLCDYMYMNSSTFVYLPYLKNPCYEECESGYNTIRCLPYFMIIGMPKSGTSSLYYHLIQHKEVVPGKRKEPMYFNRNCYRGMHLNDYTMNFDEIKTHLTAGKQFSPLITGDASADVAFDSWDWKNFPGNERLKEPKYVLPFFIRKLLPGLKIIIMLRDPVERLYSDYLFEAPLANYLLSLEDFHQAVHRAVRNHELCQAQFSVRTCAYNSSLENYKARLRVGMYYVFLMDWLNIYPQNQILVIDFDEYTKDKRKILNKVAEFLELSKLTEAESDIFLEDHEKENQRSNQTKALGDMLPVTKKMLQEFYKPFNVKLSQLLKSKKFLWSDEK